MPSGYKDWSVPVNITAQELAEVTNRPKYGGSVGAQIETSVNATTKKTMLDVSGVGMQYGGWLHLSASSGIQQLEMILSVDSAVIQTRALGTIYSKSIHGGGSTPFYLARYNTVSQQYTFGFSYGFTFDSALKLEIDNKSAIGVTVLGMIYYAII